MADIDLSFLDQPDEDQDRMTTRGGETVPEGGGGGGGGSSNEYYETAVVFKNIPFTFKKDDFVESLVSFPAMFPPPRPFF